MQLKKLIQWTLSVTIIASLQACNLTGEDTAQKQFEVATANPSPLGVNYSEDSGSPDIHRPLPSLEELNLNMDKVALGNVIFHDKRLSTDNSMGCVFCHDTMKGGDDGLKTSFGVRGQVGPINAPTVLNSAFNFRQFWDGRSFDVQDQANGPVNNPLEMGSNWPEAIEKIKNDPFYVEQFQKIYGEEMNSVHITDAIAEYERALITPSPFDKFLKGDKSAISSQAQNGYKLFTDYGCVACHQGINFGGNMFQKFGALQAYFTEKDAAEVDLGRFNATKSETDKFVFKVPSLRNIAITGPYFHNSIVDDLEGAVEIMALNQLGRTLEDNEKKDIVSFLESLTGEVLIKPAQ